MKGIYNHEKMRQATILFLEAVGDDPNRPGLKETPGRVATMYGDIMNGYEIDPKQFIKLFDEGVDQMVIVKDVPFYSFCEHHLQLFVGKLKIAYIPAENGKILGLSKLVRIARVFAKRPQVQERLTKDIHDFLSKNVPNRGIAVQIEAEHYCMSMRGVRAPGSKTKTTQLSDMFRDDDKTRNEFLEA